MKKKIIFMVINMNIGGTEKALLNMISEMPMEKYDITILMLEQYGGFLNSIPSHVHIKYLDKYVNIKRLLNVPPRIIILEYFKKGNVIKAFMLMFFQLITKIMNERSLFFRHLLRKTPALRDEYDLAVAYAGPMDFISYFVIHKIKAKSKAQWIHFDITKVGFNKHFAAKNYIKFNKVFVVSEEGKDKLIHILPDLKGRLEVINNTVSPIVISKQSNEGEGFIDDYKGIRVLTVGRLSHEKGQDLAIRSLIRLIEDGYNVRWYCLGEGPKRKELESSIEKYNLKDKFILLGGNPNPYPFIDQCDIYVQPSRYEGYCISVIEAKLLKKPIITTYVNGAKEQIIDGVNGLIVEFNENQMYKAIKNLIDNKALRKSFERNLCNEKYNASESIEKLYNLIS